MFWNLVGWMVDATSPLPPEMGKRRNSTEIQQTGRTQGRPEVKDRSGEKIPRRKGGAEQ